MDNHAPKKEHLMKSGIAEIFGGIGEFKNKGPIFVAPISPNRANSHPEGKFS
jgi:hypothetical protein